MSAIQKMMQELEPEYIKIRRYLHQHPELSFQEENTTKFIKDELNKYGIEVYDNKGFTGAVGILHGAMPGKTIALRADIDALPVKENTGLEFASVRRLLPCLRTRFAYDFTACGSPAFEQIPPAPAWHSKILFPAGGRKTRRF